MNLFMVECERQMCYQWKRILLWNILLLVIMILFRASGMGTQFIDSLQSVLAHAPRLIREAFLFLYNQNLSVETKLLFLSLSIMNLWFMCYAFGMVMFAIEKEEVMETIAFLQSSRISKRSIVVSKYLAGIASYFVMLGSVCLMSLVLTINSYEQTVNRQRVTGQLVHVFLGILIIGLFLMALGLLFVSIRKGKRGRNFIITTVTLTTSISCIPLMLQLLEMLLQRAQLSAGLVEQWQKGFEWMKYIGVLFWSFPQHTYESGMQGVCVLAWIAGIIICSALGVFIYIKRDTI